MVIVSVYNAERQAWAKFIENRSERSREAGGRRNVEESGGLSYKGGIRHCVVYVPFLDTVLCAPLAQGSSAHNDSQSSIIMTMTF